MCSPPAVYVYNKQQRAFDVTFLPRLKSLHIKKYFFSKEIFNTYPPQSKFEFLKAANFLQQL